MNYQIYTLDDIHFFAQRACHLIPRQATEDEFVDESMCDLIMAPAGSIQWTGCLQEDVDMFTKVVKSIINRHSIKGDDPDLKKAFICCSGRQRQFGQILRARNTFLEEGLDEDITAVQRQAIERVCTIWIPVESAFTDRTGGLRYKTDSWVRT